VLVTVVAQHAETFREQDEDDPAVATYVARAELTGLGDSPVSAKPLDHRVHGFGPCSTTIPYSS
jgi:hypothetical protein